MYNPKNKIHVINFHKRNKEKYNKEMAEWVKGHLEERRSHIRKYYYTHRLEINLMFKLPGIIDDEGDAYLEKIEAKGGKKSQSSKL